MPSHCCFLSILSGGKDSRNTVTFTNDGATILKSIPLDNPAAKIVVDVSKTQDAEVGDGTTSVAVLCSELLREAEKLVNQRIHPQTIIRGWRKAIVTARQSLESSSLDHSSDPVAFRQDLLNIARTTLSSKILSSNKDYFAELAVDAVLRLKGSTDLSCIQIVKKVGGSMRESFLENGFVLDKKIGIGQPRRMENVHVMVANTSLDTDKIKIYGARVKVDGVEKLSEIEDAEKDKMRAKVGKILTHFDKAKGGHCFISRQLIYNFPEQIFTDNNCMCIEHADFEGVERLALVLGAEITSTFEQPDRVKLGHCDVIEEFLVGEEKLIRFSGVAKGEACSIILRGASHQILDEAERSLHDALCVLVQTTKNTRTVYGGGCSEMLMSRAVDELALKVPGKESLAIEAFARALRAIPTIIADNAGYDSSELVTQLRAKHYAQHEAQNAKAPLVAPHAGETASAQVFSDAGLDMERGSIGSMRQLCITESLKSKMQVIISAHEAAEMILRVDDIIKCAPRQRQQDHRH